MLIRFFLWLNSLFPEIPHPFNRHTSESFSKLNYADFQFAFGEVTMKKYEDVFGLKRWLLGKNLCDFACGGGGKSLYLLRLGASHVTGVDMNSVFIEQAKQFARWKSLSDQSGFLVGDVCHTGFPSNTFDAVMMNDAIDHIYDPEKAIREALRIVKKHGLVFINFESYWFPYGHHLLDGIRIPWLHLFTTESFRMKLYAKAIAGHPDAKDRLEFRKNYLNKLTFRRFEEIMKKLEGEGLFLTLGLKKFLPRRRFFQWLARLPRVQEMFLSTGVWVMQKQVREKVSLRGATRSGATKQSLTQLEEIASLRSQ